MASKTKKEKELNYIDPYLVVKNPENPRIIFREEEMDALLRSIDQVGIQVPLSVFPKKGTHKFVLIDGERRWRCAIKLGKEKIPTIPVIIEPQPTPLNNLLMMFNIHNVRIAWDLIALADKLERVKNLVKRERHVDLTKKDLADLTGVTPATIARCEELLSLPKKYYRMIWKELEKPKSNQKYTEDLFIEIKKSIKTIDKHLPEITKEFPENKLLDIFFNKYKNGVVVNRVKFRDISKIARGRSVGILKNKLLKSILNFIKIRNYTIEKAYEETVADAYSERTNERKIEDIIGFMKDLKPDDIDNVLEKLLLDLKAEVDRLIKE